MWEDIAQEPIWLQSWIYWLILVNTASILFIKGRMEARWVFGAWVGNLLFMGFLYSAVGYVRLLGLSHVVFWTPLMIYLYWVAISRRRQAKGPQEGSGASPTGPGLVGSRAFAIWLPLLLISNSVSLVIDYVDVARYYLETRRDAIERQDDDTVRPLPRPVPGRG